MASSTASALPAPSKRQRPHLARLSALIPTKWSSGRKPLQVTVSPPETPLRSLLITSNIPTDDKQRPSPTFAVPERERERAPRPRLSRFPSGLRPHSGGLPLTPVSARHPRSASDTYQCRTACSQTETLHDETGRSDGDAPLSPSHRRSNSVPAGKRPELCSANAVWLCSPPTGKRAERPRVVRASSQKTSERRARAADDANPECMSVHSAVTATVPAYMTPTTATLAIPADASPRRSIDELPPGIYRLHSERYGSMPPTPLVSAH